MKTFLNILLVCTAGLALAACETAGLGNFDDAPPYATDRTATHEQMAKPEPAPAPAPAPEPAPAPTCAPCQDCSPLQTRISALEAELAACREASTRVRDAYSEELKK